MILYSLLTHSNSLFLWIKVCYNHHVLKIIQRQLVLTNNYATGLVLNTNVWINKNIYLHLGKCDDKKNLKYILDAAMVSIPEEITNDSPSLPMTAKIVKNQVIVNHCVFSPTYLMLKRKEQNFVLELQNTNVEPWK